MLRFFFVSRLAKTPNPFFEIGYSVIPQRSILQFFLAGRYKGTRD
jgi:hypothetical protein